MTKEKSFLDFNVDFILGQYPTYKPWAEALSLFAIAAANPEAKTTGGGPGIPLTMNPMAMGPSRMAFKSLPLVTIIEPMLTMSGVISLPPRFTVEAYYSHIHEKKIKDAVLIRDEAAGIVTETRKQYLADELAFLCELLDGRLRGRITITHGFMSSIEVRVNFATACTPQLLTMLDADFWTLGLGNRLVLVYWIKPVTDSIPAIPSGENELYFKNCKRQGAEMLKRFRDTGVTWVVPEERVENLCRFEEFERRKQGYNEYFQDKLDIIPSMYYEGNVFMKKIAALKAIDRQPGIKEPIVNMEDYNWAKKWVEDRFEEFEQMNKDWIITQQRKRSGTIYRTPEMRMFECLERHREGLTLTDFNNLTHLRSSIREDVLKKMVEENTIIVKTEYVCGKPVDRYFLKSN